ncbi:MAG: hypothetical protein IT267_12315 [Saprospiraceae bacterium]|nr:hypothetical protein [Saprospiraceae bacterium]
MNISKIVFVVLFVTLSAKIIAQEDSMVKMEKESLIRGFHIGYVQPLKSIKNAEEQWLFTYERFSMGFPIGISLNTPGALIIDLEFVPFIKPYFGNERNIEVHLLYHPGVLLPIGYGLTLGLRAAFELGVEQIGFSPLINKSFDISKSTKGFVELVLPGRFGPDKASGYTQVFALHVGVGF